MNEERDGMHPSGDDEEVTLLYEDVVVADLRAVFERPAAPDVAARHLAAMRAAARDLLPPVASEAAESPFWTWPRRVAAAVAAVAVALFGLGGLGMAGALPDPVQDLVSSVAEHVGIDVPRAHEDDTGGSDSGRDGGAVDPSTAPGQAGSTPGQSGQTPGQSGQTPADGAEPPGQVGSTPGQSGDNPSATAPGQVDNPSATAPGQVENPGATAPGKVDPPAATAPGQGKDPSATAPGATAGPKGSVTTPTTPTRGKS